MSTATSSTLQQQFLSGSTPIPNWFFELILSNEQVTDSVSKTFLFLFRKTVGWNKRSEEQSLSQIMAGANLKSRHTAIHAVQILCDCWEIWKKTRGRKGEHSSIFEIAGVTDQDVINERMILTDFIYDTTCPTLEDLRDLPPTAELYEAVKLIMKRNAKNVGHEIEVFVQQQRTIGQQKRASRAEQRRAKSATNALLVVQ